MTKTAMTIGLKYCYTKIGKPTRRILTNPLLTAVVGAYMDTKSSVKRIDGFIRHNHIDMSDCVETQYKCFNDFFTRRLKDGARPIDPDPEMLISPCDGYLSAYRISADSEFAIKDSFYNVEDLVGGDEIAAEYLSGICLVLRLGVENYHRYCYIDNGFKSRNYHIKGRYHPVQPIVVHKHPVFKQNTREYCMLETENFGTVTQIEVGACMVGKIKNHHEAGVIHRGCEKGMFLFGGSTIVLRFKNGVLDIPDDLFDATAQGKEAVVRYGEAIARKAK